MSFDQTALIIVPSPPNCYSSGSVLVLLRKKTKPGALYKRDAPEQLLWDVGGKVRRGGL